MPPRNVSNEAIWEKLGALDAITQAMERDRKEAREDRRALYQRVEESINRIEKVELLARDTSEKLDEVMPTISEFKNLKMKAAGVIVVLIFIGSVVSWFANMFADNIKAWFGH